jgi:glycosyltransferase involved in cell wall biosynthesis
MKIAYIYDAVYPWVKGGAEKRIYEISKRLVKRGHEVHWFGIKWWDGEEDIVREGVYLHGIGEWDNLYVEGRRSIKEGLYFGIKTLTGLKGYFDIIDCQEFPYFSCFSAKMHSLVKKSKLIITWHEIWGDYWFEYLGRKGFFGWAVEKMTSKLTGKNVAVSERTKRDLERIGVRKEIEIIPNGIDFGEIEKIRASEEESDVIFAGRLIEEKNVDILIKAVELVKKEIPDVKCRIIGDGPEKRKLEKLATDLGLGGNIKFTVFLENHDEVISYMKSSKVFVLPSTREGFGIVALEANACGLPVVTVNHKRNAVCDFITDENGFICELSGGNIAEKIFMALDGRKDGRKRYNESAKKYDWSEISDLLEKFYKEEAIKNFKH